MSTLARPEIQNRLRGQAGPRDRIQEAVRMHLQPIKNDNPQLDPYTMNKRETVEYDTEYMTKYNEDLNTTFILVGSAFRVSPLSADYILRPVDSPQYMGCLRRRPAQA